MNLDKHPYFEKWADPESGIVSYILDKHVAPIQQSLYFNSNSLSDDQQWLWFYAGFPPSEHKMLGVVSMDPANPFIRTFPGTAWNRSAPMVAPEGDAIYFCMNKAVWKQPVDSDAQKICELDPEFAPLKGRPVERLATHLTLSADGKYFLLDGKIGLHWFIGLGDIQTGKIEILTEFGRHYNHAQFSPVDPDLFLLSQDWWVEPASGKIFGYDNRMWLMNVQQTMFEPVCPDHWVGRNSKDCHEWWSKDGWVCWIDYDKGAFELNLSDREANHVWQRPLCHAHCSGDRRYFCADQTPYKWPEPCMVLFYDRKTGKETRIVSKMPAPPINRKLYHLDPHPQFSPRNDLIVYTTQVRGKSEVALTPIDQLTE